jgi:hypothetical protein
MYDRATNSLWVTLTGEPVIGPLANSGLKLKLLPMTVTTWGEWLAAHPDTKVLDIATGFDRPYIKLSQPGSAYYAYFREPGLMFPVYDLDASLPAKANVFGIRLEEGAIAYEVEAVARERVVNSRVGRRNVVVIGDTQSKAVRAYDSKSHTFSPGGAPLEVVDEQGRAWTAHEDALALKGGDEELARLPGHNAFWFAWRTFNPGTGLFTGNPPAPT